MKIQRASAGSGKTYALARTFILNLISYEDEKGRRVLRNKNQIEEALQHLLAITFTNKATNEMKQRIVDNLSKLSQAADPLKLGDLEIKKIPYLEEFHKILNEPYEKIGEASLHGLKTVLNNYSYFKISTIDSFFQEILRTFAYEANISESYQVEIDSSFVTDSAIDAAIKEMDYHPSKMGNTTFWIRTIMQQEAKKNQRWNLFNSRGNARSIYNNIRNALFQLEGEEFKEVKQQLDSFFEKEENITNLRLAFLKLREKAVKERADLLREIQTSGNIISRYIDEESVPANYMNAYLPKHLDKIKSLKIWDKFGAGFSKIIKDQSIFNKKYRVEGHPIDEEAMKMYDNLIKWDNPEHDSYTKGWLIYGPLFPYLGLLLEVRKFLSDILDSENLIRISDTSFILKKIIGESETPFIYERLGNKIHNYLIDEFQDTSKMQWDILYPLLSESESKGQASLIIGDPKQSIYRFRNADHTLITEVVPRMFPNHKTAGFSKADNTNWRSHTNIVNFNNYFFRRLSGMMQQESLANGNCADFEGLYSNTVQYSHNRENKGYIEFRFFEAPEEEAGKEADSSGSMEPDSQNWYDKIVLDSVAELVNSLLERGYRQKDICILVSKNDDGKKVVEKFVAFNETIENPDKKINIVSEESLLISSSTAVKTVIGVLEKLASPVKEEEEKPEEDSPEDNRNKRKYYNWQKLEINYRIYASKNPDVDTYKKVLSFLETDGFEDGLTLFMDSLPTPSLSSIVESIIKIFVDDNLRDEDALYLSSFQDILNEYLASHSDSPASFLEWWNSRSHKLTVSSPESIDAVEIMTIHKSKGLEFKCVIMPYATETFIPSPFKNEWRWVSPLPYDDIDMPVILPVLTTTNLQNSIHEKIYKDYYDQILTDRLNMYYVAFTRARNELYVFTKNPKKKGRSLPDYVRQILNSDTIQDFSGIQEEERAWMVSPEILDFSEEDIRIKIGTPFTSLELAEEINKEKEKEERESTRFFESYYINSKRPVIRSVSSTMSPSGDLILQVSKQ